MIEGGNRRMNRIHCVGLCLALFLAGMLMLVAPGMAKAAPNLALPNGYQDNTGEPKPEDRNLISVPGIFKLLLGQSSSPFDGTLRLDGAQVELPRVNATVSIDGLAFSPANRSFGWDAVNLIQSQPFSNETVTVSDTRATVQGSETNFSTEVSARVDVHPDEANQASATMALHYDGMSGQSSLAVADGNARVTAGPATVMVDGVNAGDGGLTVDTAQVVIPEAETGFRVGGFTVVDGNASWETLDWYGREFNLGNVVTLSDNLVVIPGPGSENAEAGGATTTIEVNAGDLAEASGQLIFTYDQAAGQPVVALRNGSAALGVADSYLAVNGINVSPDGATVDSVQMSFAPLSLQTQVTGVAIDDSSGLTFDQAMVRYRPDTAEGNRPFTGFDLVIDSSEDGYVVTTTTIFPVARADQS
ncbi:MAG: hypothetical protein GY759_09945 [Chloroflexi bacterium]|nr:hypothetical protein [Chloroflexota bacterium]